MNGERWFNSEFGRRAGLGVALVGLGLFVSSCMEGCGKWNSAVERAHAEVENAQAEHTGDLDGNGIPDKFYIINGKIAPIEMNGVPIMRYSFNGTNGHYHARNSLGK